MPQPSGQANRVASLLVPCAFAASAFIILYVLLFVHIWGDQAFLLYAAKLVLSGVTLDGPRLIETNPPLIVWFSTIPDLIASALHIQPALALQMLVLAIITASSAWCLRILRSWNAGIAPIIASLVFAAEAVIQPALFGQREQVFLALVMPFVLLFATGQHDSLAPLHRASIGLCAGLGVCFKPQQVLTIVVVTAVVVALRKSLRPLVSVQVLAAVAAGLVYVAAVRLFTPYLTNIVPLLRDTYWALGPRRFGQLLLHDEAALTALLLLAVLLLAVSRKRLPDLTLPAVLLAASGGALAAVYVQHTGWSYQAFPAKALLALAVITMALQWLATRERGLHFVPPPALVWAICAISVSLALFAGRHKAQRDDLARGAIDADMAQFPAGTVVYAFSIEMSQFRVILEHNLVWGSRYAHLWMLPAITQNEQPRTDTHRIFKALSPQRTAQLAGTLRQSTAQDLAAWKPQVVYVEKCSGPQLCELFNHPLDIAAWFSQDPAFRGEWSHYRLQRSIDRYNVFIRDDSR